jgi:hypothetical protein
VVLEHAFTAGQVVEQHWPLSAHWPTHQRHDMAPRQSLPGLVHVVP